MIRDSEGKKTTPRDAAKELIFTALSDVYDYWQDGDLIIDVPKMTNHERELVHVQMQKILNSISRRHFQGEYVFK